ncbi:Uridine phosphorylase 1 [Gracilariopsis chorda]|uniref:Uridine phosphorylase 1 n=1 Tax=Gracilariopsis chorda TaxID=448386 RepID=A0A2V3IN22_9FLOR|nr:Uridine phosphorylase 1 [Gracilariopsis chorda]|eukprot:PXF43457.1 Uridine phosphorylase 1 [Gracilariopsis chorda]
MTNPLLEHHSKREGADETQSLLPIPRLPNSSRCAIHCKQSARFSHGSSISNTHQPEQRSSDNVILFHLGFRLPQDKSTLVQHLSSVRFVVLCGSFQRAHHIAKRFTSLKYLNHCHTDRYLLLQPLPSVLVAAHGIGTGSIDVLLHEIYNALDAAGASNWCFIRIGTCGGLGVPPGTLVFTRRALSGDLKPSLRMFVLGEQVRFPATLDSDLTNSLVSHGKAMYGSVCVHGDTLCAETFHIAQGRTDGAFVPYTEEQKLSYFRRCRSAGVVNLEMESLALAAFSSRVNVPAAVLCVVLVDRLEHETPVKQKHELGMFEERAIRLLVSYVLSHVTHAE